jgi:hypothetical protein
MGNQPPGEARHAVFRGPKKKFKKFLLTADFIHVTKIKIQKKE